MSLRLKVCGMREAENIQALGEVAPDFIGLIFFSKSPRDASGFEVDDSLAHGIIRVGVFVNPTLEEVLKRAESHHLDYIQLHGDEPVSLVQEIRASDLGVIKVFRVDSELPVETMKLFEKDVDFFLFDTRTRLFGGSGIKFDWDILKNYPFDTPYFLSGGIDLEDVEKVKNMDLPGLFAIDINSRFEVVPGRKDIEKIKKVKELL